MTKQKIAVLGGGIGSLSAVFALTDQANWQENYEITVYQLGWRLGGKGASGRQQSMGDRIEEHGLHVWFGFYENSFQVMQKCYAEVNQHNPNYPYKIWDQAFEQHHSIGIEEFHNGQWKNWFFAFPPNNEVPGQGLCYPVLLGCIGKIFSLITKEIDLAAARREVFPEIMVNSNHQTLLGAIPEDLKQELAKHGFAVQKAVEQQGVLGLVKLIERLLVLGGDDLRAYTNSQKGLLQDLIAELLKFIHLIEDVIDTLSDTFRRILLLMELAVVALKGLWKDGFFEQGFQAVPDIDLRQWFKQYGASDNLIYSPLTQAVYDLFFSFLQGETGVKSPPIAGDISARASLHYMMRAVCCYKGAVMWKMKAGMGDIIFTPLYLTLKERGVKFKFFQRITELVPNSNHDAIAEIVLNEQVTLNSGEYNPLVNVKDLPCWPSQPQYSQIVQSAPLQAQQINLESYWTPWPDVNQGIRLKRGEDFDLVICGISIAALKLITPQLISGNPQWQQMVNNIQTVPTLAMQNWLVPNIEGLGWIRGSVILDTYVEPFNTWADMSQTLAAENWSPLLGFEPQNVSYFCGPAVDYGIPPPEMHDFPAEQTNKIKGQAIQWMKNNVNYLWPRFTWSMLIDPANQEGERRFSAQYWRVNIDPTERYVLAASGTDQYRLKTNESGYGNLYLAGDWVNNTFMNIGAIEPTVISGLRASQAISGYPKKIICVSP
ncbi:MAG: hypothetical protein BWK79_17400 [Beggiatoa sp. IS2]|nr:MAG: hypothetical protein BWK79_17400 [Beggiatoa sp. IS2]